MKTKLYSLLCLFVVFAWLQGKAQNVRTSTTDWSADAVLNIKNGDSFSHSSVLRVHQADKIKWIQKSGAITFTFDITSLQGEWADVSQPGSVTYQVVHDGKAGTITIERTPEKIKVSIDLTQGDPAAIHYDLNINQVSVSNEQ